jgi:hypothetical protein
MRKSATAKKDPKLAGARPATAACLCGAVRIEIVVPAFWAWHDHSKDSRRAQGCAYATYIGVWKSKTRVVQGAGSITRFEDAKTRTARSFCGKCGTPLFYERPRAPKMVNIPRALFDTRTGREPLYHIAWDEAAEWEYRGEALKPLKGFPGVMWTGAKRKKPPAGGGIFA